MPRINPHLPHCEIFILAGGLSTRMGRDKARVRLGSRTMLEHVRAQAAQTGLRVRVIRRDAVARCGPLGGIYTGLKRSRAEMVLFLACDMPFVSVEWLKRMLKIFGRSTPPPPPKGGRGRAIIETSARSQISPALFASEGGRAGFPCLLRRETALPVVSRQIELAQYSLQSLAQKLRAKTLLQPRSATRQLANINTPTDLKRAAQRLRHIL